MDGGRKGHREHDGRLAPARSARADEDHGVPFPGERTPRERWTRTRCSLPREGALFDWAGTFGREAPRVVDLGCGNGRYLLASALARPSHDHLGVDLVPPAIQHAARRASERGLANVRYAQGDAIPFALTAMGERTLDEVHIYHPQPFYDPLKRRLRMLTPELVGAIRRALRPGGRFVLQTDNPAYWRHILTTVPVLFDWREQVGPWPDAPLGRTRREIFALSRRLKIFRGEGLQRSSLSDTEASEILARLPEPTFDADKKEYRRKRR